MLKGEKHWTTKYEASNDEIKTIAKPADGCGIVAYN